MQPQRLEHRVGADAEHRPGRRRSVRQRCPGVDEIAQLGGCAVQLGEQGQPGAPCDGAVCDGCGKKRRRRDGRHHGHRPGDGRSRPVAVCAATAATVGGRPRGDVTFTSHAGRLRRPGDPRQASRTWAAGCRRDGARLRLLRDGRRLGGGGNAGDHVCAAVEPLVEHRQVQQFAGRLVQDAGAGVGFTGVAGEFGVGVVQQAADKQLQGGAGVGVRAGGRDGMRVERVTDPLQQPPGVVLRVRIGAVRDPLRVLHQPVVRVPVLRRARVVVDQPVPVQRVTVVVGVLQRQGNGHRQVIERLRQVPQDRAGSAAIGFKRGLGALASCGLRGGVVQHPSDRGVVDRDQVSWRAVARLCRPGVKSAGQHASGGLRVALNPALQPRAGAGRCHHSRLDQGLVGDAPVPAAARRLPVGVGVPPVVRDRHE